VIVECAVHCWFCWLTQDGVEYVAEENIAQYSVHDIVLPLPGCDVLFPKNKGGRGK